MTSKKQSKKIDPKIFTSICNCIKNDMYPEQIAEFLSKKTSKKWSKQRVHYWISRLKKEGYIRKILRTSFTKYALTDKSKKFLIHHEKPNYHGHAIEVSYLIIDKGNLPEGNINMNNWSYWIQKFGDFSIKVHYAKENKLIIYPPNVYEDTRTELLLSLGEKLATIVNFIQRTFNCEVDWNTRNIERRLEVHAPKDRMGKLFEKEKLNEHGENIEVNQSGHAHFDVNGTEAFERYDQMITEFPTLKETMGSISMNQRRILNLHAISTETLSRISRTLEFMANRPIRKVKKIIARPLNWWLR